MNWSQDVMAQECGLSLTTIHNLEKGFRSTRSSEEIRKKLEDKGFEFFGRKGISLREDTHRTYEGRDGCQKFCENLLSTAKENGGEIIAVFRSVEILVRSLGVSNFHELGRLEELSQYATVKCLLTDATNPSLTIPFFQFKAVSQYTHSLQSFITYGNNYAVIITKDGVEPFYYVAHDVAQAQNDRKEFALRWQNGLSLASSHRS